MKNQTALGRPLSSHRQIAVPRELVRRSSLSLSIGRLRFRGPIAALLLALLPGCASVGHDFPVAYVSSIEKGTTTQADIKNRFGEPWRVGVEDGQTTWTYGKYKYRLFGQPSTTDLVVRFNTSGVVASYSFSTTEYDEGEVR